MTGPHKAVSTEWAAQPVQVGLVAREDEHVDHGNAEDEVEKEHRPIGEATDLATREHGPGPSGAGSGTGVAQTSRAAKLTGETASSTPARNTWLLCPLASHQEEGRSQGTRRPAGQSGIRPSLHCRSNMSGSRSSSPHPRRCSQKRRPSLVKFR